MEGCPRPGGSFSNSALLSGTSADNLFQQCQTTPSSVKTLEQARTVSGFQCDVISYAYVQKTLYSILRINHCVYGRDLPVVSVNTILIGQHGLFPRVSEPARMRLQPWKTA